MTIGKLLVCGFASALLALGGSITQVNNRIDFGPTDYVPFSVLGADLNTLGTSFNRNTTVFGTTVSFSEPNGNFQHRSQSTGSWMGNLPDYPNILFTGALATPPSGGTATTGGTNATFTGTNNAYGSGPITIAFGVPMFGAGFDIQSYLYGQFAATLAAYSGTPGSGTLLGSVSINGTSAASPIQGQKRFLGLRDTEAEINYVVVSVIDANSNPLSFGINRLELLTPLPEPSTLSMFAGGALLAGGRLLLLWRRGRSRG